MEYKERFWREIEKDIELYKFYLEILLKSAIFVFGITGAIISYYFTHDSNPLIVYSLILPLLMNCGFFLICFFSIQFAEIMKDEHYRVCEKAGVETPYEMSPLPNMLRLFSVIHGLVTLGIATLFLLSII